MSSIRIAGTLFVVVGALATPSPSAAYTLRESESGKPVRWHEAERSVRIDESLARLGPAADARAAVDGALAAWASVEGSPFDFECAPGFKNGLGMGRRLDGISDVTTVDADWQFDSSFLAITLVTYDPGSGEIWDADVVLNTDQHDFGAGELAPGQFDVASVVTHEVGHLLGLAHSEIADATMYAYSRPGETDKRTLAADDEEGLQALYLGQSMDGGAGCSVARGPRRVGVLGWIAVGAAACLLCRRRVVR